MAAAAPVAPVLMLSPAGDNAMLLGGVGGGQWRTAAQVRPTLRGEASYRAASLTGFIRRVRLGAPLRPDVPCAETTFLALRSGPPRIFEVVTTGSQTLQPRPVTPLPLASPVYREIVRQELVRRGLGATRVNLTNLLRADLDGNGTAEVIIEASLFREARGDFFPPPQGAPGDYSLLLLRSVVGGQAKTTVLGEYRGPSKPKPPGAEGDLASLNRVAAIADLNGDGRMELVVYSAYYEGASYALLDWTAAGGPKVRLEAGCGA